MRRATEQFGAEWLDRLVSIHARHATGDSGGICLIGCRCFNSRPSCDGRHERSECMSNQPVSIHARHATGDVDEAYKPGGKTFQFTPVMRRATSGDPGAARDLACFNSRPSCDGRRARHRLHHDRRRFNSRPSCDGRQVPPTSCPLFVLFQFTPVMRRATRLDGLQLTKSAVSILARHATGDSSKITVLTTSKMFQFTPVMRRATNTNRISAPWKGFNSRPSCDGRPSRRTRASRPRLFQFTPVMRRATP